VLIAESNVHHIPDYVDRIYVLERGEVMFSGTWRRRIATATSCA
jgi:branched-chain amino acid transport system ATP-binding protein